MIGKLRRKFVLFAMLSIILVTVIIFGVIAIEMRIVTDYELDHLISFIADNNGQMPDFNNDFKDSSNIITVESKFATRYFTVFLDSDLNITLSNTDRIAMVNSSDIENMVKDVLSYRKTKGYYGNEYRYLVRENESGKMIVFLEARSKIRSYNDFIQKSSIIIGLGLLITLVFASLLSKKAAGPIIESIEKQKQFITNAGHDLKTPVSIILANADVLEMRYGEDEWTGSIKKQAKKLDMLIKNLLNLAKIDENNKKKSEITEFDLNELIMDEVNGIKVLAKDKEILFENEEENIIVTKDKTAISQVLTILLDNAIKYTDENGKIIVKVEKHGKGYAKIDISNPYSGDMNINVNKLFDRFYRADKSRNASKEGYGIGLSMAKSIVEVNKGKIYSYIDSNSRIHFIVII